TTCSRSRKTASIGKRMKKVWIDDAGRSRMPSPLGRLRRPRRPRARVKTESATRQCSQTGRPSSRWSEIVFIGPSSDAREESVEPPNQRSDSGHRRNGYGGSKSLFSGIGHLQIVIDQFGN